MLSDDLIWPVLHELTHHASLQTPVGQPSPKAALPCRTHEWEVKCASTPICLDRGPLRDVVRLAAVNPLFRPLLEGMALFAEFDATSGDVPVATCASQVADCLFYFPESRDALAFRTGRLSPLVSCP